MTSLKSSSSEAPIWNSGTLNMNGRAAVMVGLCLVASSCVGISSLVQRPPRLRRVDGRMKIISTGNCVGHGTIIQSYVISMVTHDVDFIPFDDVQRKR